jgi:hypothetical protein
MPISLDLIAPEDDFVKLPCGGFNWRIYWVLNGADKTTKGAVVQKIDVTVNRTTCDGKDVSWSLIFWEAFVVTGGAFVPLQGTQIPALGAKPGTPPRLIQVRGDTDDFRQASNMDSKGHIRVLALAKFIPNWKQPAGMTPHKLMKIPNHPRRLTPAGALPATQTQPPGWDDNDVDIRRVVRVRWDCCTDEKSSYAYGWAKPTE